MKKKILVLTGCIYASSLIGTNAQGITFTNGLNWKQVLEKAKKEQKLVLVDCYTTWCAPCKKMDQEVYPQEAVGTVTNKNFISIKVQMDTATNDDPEVKSWYAQAHEIRQRYHVTAYPTYLIISPNGDILQRESGARKAEIFINIMQTASDSGKVYAKQLLDWKTGKKDYTFVPSMIRKAEKAKDVSTAHLLARTYIEQYIPTLPKASLYNANLLGSIGAYVLPSDKKLFNLFYPQKNGQVTDSILQQKGLSATIATSAIEKELNAMLIKNNDFTQPIIKKPDWEKITKLITSRYDAITADKLVNIAQRNWYKITKPDWNLLAQYQLYNIQKNPPSEKWGFAFANNEIWYDIFSHVEETAILEKAASVVKNNIIDVEEKQMGKPSAGYIDTYANLLFKLGRRKEAIEWQQKAVALRPEIKTFAETLKKMEKGEPTWPSR